MEEELKLNTELKVSHKVQTNANVVLYVLDLY